VHDVIGICLTCEKFFRRIVYNATDSTLHCVKCHEIVQSVMEAYVNRDAFADLTDQRESCLTWTLPGKDHIHFFT
jgi:hypothetical protein